MLSLVVSAFIGPAFAYPCDSDGDWYTTGSGCGVPPFWNFGPDCDDSDSNINPHEAEIALDDVDQTCDGSDGIRRRLQLTLNSGSFFTSTGSVTWGGDTVTIDANEAIELTSDVVFNKGLPTAVIDRASMTAGDPCFLTVTGYNNTYTGSPSTQNTPIGGGVQLYPLTGLPRAPLTITDFKVRCGASAGTIALDWIVLQDGSDDVDAVDQVWPPAEELETDWLDTEMPGGGAATTLLVSTSYGLWAGSDVGGLAYSADDGVTWETMNGLQPAFVYQQDLAIWGILPFDTDDVYVLTGDEDSSGGLHGGLWRTEDAGATWEQLFTEADGIAADGRLAECNATNAFAGGRLLATDGVDTVVVASHESASEGVWLVDSGTLCELDDSEAALPGAGHYISALAVDLDATTGPSLLVGYKSIDSTTEALYRCELADDVDINCADTVACYAVADSEGLDVRDIEIDPNDPETVYVAHGGRVDTSGTCTFGDPTVYEWSFHATDPTQDTLRDLDASGELSRSTDQTYHDSTGQGEVVGLGVDPDSDYLFAVLPGKQDGYYSRIPELVRLDLGSETWEDMTGRTDTAPYTDDATHRAQRESGVDGLDTWMADQVYKAQWAGAYAVDAVFVEDTVGSNDPMLVADGFGVWDVANAQGSLGDPDTTVDWTFLLDSNGDTTGKLFQLTVPNGIAVSPLDGSLFAATSDLGLVYRPGTGGRSEVDCIWDQVNGAGADVSVVPTSDGANTAVWVAITGGSTHTSDAIFRSDDGGLSWCYEATSASLSWTDGGVSDNAVCKDLTGDQPPCNDGAQLVSKGNPMSVAAVNEMAAVATFKTDGATPGTIAYTIDGGETWTDLAFDTAEFSNCDEDEFFEVKSELVLRVHDFDGDPATSATYAEDSDADGDADTWAFDIFVTGESNDSAVDCGLARVTWDDGAPTAVWTKYATGSTTAGDCHISALNISGVEMSPWKDRVVIWGSYASNWGGAGSDGGGICSIDVADDGNRGLLLAPASWNYSIEDVVPHPTMVETFAYAPLVNAQLSSDSGCCSVPDPAVVENRATPAGTWSWTQENMDTTGLQGVAGLGLAWYDDGVDTQIFYGAHGTGVSVSEIAW